MWTAGWRGKAAHKLANTAEECWLDPLGSSLEEGFVPYITGSKEPAKCLRRGI